MISSGNALPPTAYHVVCDIDVQGHDPIKQRDGRVILRYLSKLYELLNRVVEGRTDFVYPESLGVFHSDRLSITWRWHMIMHRL